MHPVRKTRRRYEVPSGARSLTFSTLGRRPILDDHARTIVGDQIARTHAQLNFSLFAWVVMPEHVHLLIRIAPGGPEVPRILSAIKRRSATRVLSEWRAVGRTDHRRLWQPGGGYDRNVRERDSIPETIRYIHLNPVRRDLAETPEQWTWSSARAWAQQETRWPRFDPWP